MIVRILRTDPDYSPEASGMEFRLTYGGPLLGASKNNTRASHKHEIRKDFHKQLLRFWNTHPYLKIALLSHPQTGYVKPPQKLFDYHAKQYERLGYNFVPLITPDLSLICRVDILLLRPAIAGQLIINSGDLDNRLKTIFDALRMPQNKDELGGFDAPDENEKPFCVLLTDDKLINHVAIETDTLLQPLDPVADQIDENDARLVVKIHLHPTNQGWHNINFG